jgi:hypothetical protein
VRGDGARRCARTVPDDAQGQRPTGRKEAAVARGRCGPARGQVRRQRPPARLPPPSHVPLCCAHRLARLRFLQRPKWTRGGAAVCCRPKAGGGRDERSSQRRTSGGGDSRGRGGRAGDREKAQRHQGELLRAAKEGGPAEARARWRGAGAARRLARSVRIAGRRTQTCLLFSLKLVPTDLD